MPPELQATQKSLYETDFVRWVESTVEQLRTQDYANVDWANLIEEIESMSKQERKSLRSNLKVILLHLLKWQYQPNRRSKSWRSSLREHRDRIVDDLKDSPSLKPYLQEIFSECYDRARAQAADETDLPLDTFPADCPYTPEQAIDSDFLPG
jgi:flagellar biosynthesis regulator FlaF